MLLSFILFLTNVPLFAQTTISSTAAGGLWNAPATWAGGTVPAAGNHVVINGPVAINGTFSCVNLTINSTGHLHNDTFYNTTFTVTGNVVNNGKISNHPTSSYRLWLDLKGNVENNGTWTVLKTSLTGNGNQTLKQAAGKQFEGEFETTDANGDILLGSNVTFANNLWELRSSRILTSGYRLITSNYTLRNGTIVSNDHLELNNTIADRITMEGNYTIHGKLRIQHGVVLKGNPVLADTLHNDTFFNTTLRVEGNLTNEGYLITHPTSSYLLGVDLLANVTNKGKWAPYNTAFKATADQQVGQLAGKQFEGIFLKSDSLGRLLLSSDVTFVNSSFELSKGAIHTNGHLLETRNYTLSNGKIHSNERMLLRNTILSNISITGNYKLDGRIRVQHNVVLNDQATLLDTLHNDTFHNTTLHIRGKFTNQGTLITNPSTSYTLDVDIWNDFTNEGKWAPFRTFLRANVDRKISQTEGKSFEGYFEKRDSTGKVLLGSNVTFRNNTFELGKGTLAATGYELETVNYTLRNGKIESDRRLWLRNTILAVVSLSGDYKLAGRMLVQHNVVLNGLATLLDTLHNDTFFNTTLHVRGKMVNEGTLINHPSSSYRLTVDVWNHLENKGKWAPLQTSFRATTDQQISQLAGKQFEGYFYKSDTLGKVVLGSDVKFFNNTFDLNKSTLQCGGFTLHTQNFTLKNGKINSEGTLWIQNSILVNMAIFGNYRLRGKTWVQHDVVLNGLVTLTDTLHNDTFFTTTLRVRGNMVNEGAVINHPASSYTLDVDVWGNLNNKNIWAPKSTILKGTADQQLSQAAGKSFRGAFLEGDTISKIVLGSDVHFADNGFNLSKGTLVTNGFKLSSDNYTFSNGKIISQDTITWGNTILSNIKLHGDPVLKGKIKVQNDNIFTGNVTLEDTLFNDTFYTTTLVFNGTLVNNGHLTNHPTSSYRLSLRINGDLQNNNRLSVENIYLYGTNERNIGGRNGSGILARIWADDPIVLTGTNSLPNLNFTGKTEAGCTVKAGSILNLMEKTTYGKVKNYGRVSISQDLANTSTATFDFFGASASIKGNPAINQLTVDNYGYQQHPTSTGTIHTWWRLRPVPVLSGDSLIWLKLSYPEDALNGNNEDSLKVFHSPNSGLTWRRLRTAITIDKTNNVVTIPKAPSGGHYLLSSSALGVTSFQPLVESAEPRFGGNSGQLTMYLFGAGFKASSKVKLTRSGGIEIKADTTWLTDGIGESMLARFNLKNKALGVYNVVVETPGSPTIELPDYFTLQQGERSNPWSALSGRDRFLLNRWSTFQLSYGNTANTDAMGNILVFVVNDLPGLEIDFPDVNIILPKPLVDMGPNFTRFRDSVDIYYVTDSLSGYENIKMRVYPFYIPYIAAGSSGSVRVRVKLPGQGSLRMDSWLLDPLYEVIDYNLKAAEPMPAEVRACITAAAMKAWYSGMVGLGSSVVPGLACWSVIDKTVDPIGYITPDELKPEEKKTWGSYLWKAVSIMGSAVQCGASFVPVVGTAVSLGIGMVNMAIDMKDGYDATEGCWRKFRKKSQSKLNSNGVNSFDPNEKVGPQGYTTDRYISKEGNLNYTIFFENLKTAGAAALEVFITDTLDVNKFDFRTFSFNTIAFGDTSVKIQEYAREFKILLDLYPEKNILLQVHGKLDTLTGIASWSFHSLDRITKELTEDPDGGFLPPNVNSPEGEGHVTFSCKLKHSVVHGDVISNRASIVFDLNKPILTNTYINRIDDRIPASYVLPLALEQEDSVFTVAWTGSDQGSQIASYNIFVSVNDSSYVLWKVAKTSGTAEFKGKNGYKYRFFSVAADSLGFAEPVKTGPEAITTVKLNTSTGITGASEEWLQVYPNPAGEWCQVSFTLDRPAEMAVWVEDITGRRVAEQPRQNYPAGVSSVRLSLGGLREGMYMIRVSGGEKVWHRKVLKR